jgi:uncharacterized protein DUF2784
MNAMFYTILADAVVAVHLGYVAFVLIALLLILLGIPLRWQWVRNLRFRLVHLIMVEVVALEGAFGILCPMTTWETKLRELARREPTPEVAPPAAVSSVPAPPASQSTEAVAPAPATPSTPTVPTPKKTNPTGNEAPSTPTVPVPSDSAPPPVMPTSAPEQTQDKDTTFVGRLLDSILFLNVPQAVLDRWYERFGFLTLVVFLVLPPRLGSWSRCGLTGAALLWVGTLFSAAAYYDWIVARGDSTAESPLQSWYGDAALVTGLAVLAVGGVCLWRGATRGISSCDPLPRRVPRGGDFSRSPL